MNNSESFSLSSGSLSQKEKVNWDGDIFPQPFTSSPIFLVCWNLKREGYAESTIEGTGKRLRNLAGRVNLLEPDRVYRMWV